MHLPDGIVLRGIGGFYTVSADEGGGSLECRPRGRLKRAGNMLPGDRVRWEPPAEGGVYGTIESVHPRRTQLDRPPVANVDLAVVVDSLAEPAPNPLLVDRILALALFAGMDVALCMNKVDLVDKPEQERRLSPYREAEIPLLGTSAKRGDGIRELRALLSERIATFAGPSGVGKSSLLNAVQPSSLETGDISPKLGRGRHTTRHTELIPLKGGGLVADTPGFHQVSVAGIPKAGLGELFPEIARLADGCRFRSCLHLREPDCAVRTAAEQGAEAAASRYENYVKLLEEILRHEEFRYR